MAIIGIDNGLNGGIVALSPIGGLAPVFACPLPTMEVYYPARKTTKARTVREIDTRGLVAIFRHLAEGNENMTVFFEHCPFHADNATMMRSMGISAGKILAILEARGLKIVRVLSHDWHPVILGKVPRGKTKHYARLAAASIWPEEKWLATERSTVAHDGMIDAALIAEYGRRQLTGEYAPTLSETLTQPQLIQS
jgi:hypothetical protein